MKRIIFYLLTLCLLLGAAVAMAAPTIPDSVDPSLLTQPEDVHFTYSIEGDVLTVNTTDQRTFALVDISFNGATMAMKDAGSGRYTVTLQPSYTTDEDLIQLIFNVSKKDGTESVIYSLSGKRLFSDVLIVTDTFSWMSAWDDYGYQHFLSKIYSNDQDETVQFNFDPATGEALGYTLMRSSNGIAAFGTDHQLQSAQLLMGDKSYIYDGYSWMITDPYGNSTPCDAPVSLAYLYDVIEDIMSYARRKAIIENAVWHPKNSVCAVGLSVRDDLKISDLWYNVVPIDLTQEGTQELYLVAGNRHHIGKAYVTVANGDVTVTYRLHSGHGYIKSECVKWFTSLDQITEEFLKNPTSDLAFGQAVNIEEELGGADMGILFIRNIATYRQPYTNTGGELSRYWRNRDRWIEWRDGLNALLEK